MIEDITDPPDLVVVGGGPAGTTLAGLVALRGWSVVLLDRARFPRPKPCGECLNPGAVASLDRLGLLDDVLALEPAVLEGWVVRTAGAEARGRFGGGLRALGVPRIRLDMALLDAARARGVKVIENAHVVSVQPATKDRKLPTVTVRFRGGPESVVEGRVVAGADGLRSVVSRSINASSRAPKLRRVSLTSLVSWRGRTSRLGMLDVRDGITLGVARVSRCEDLWNVTVVADSRRHGPALRVDPNGFVQQVLEARVGDGARVRVVNGPWASGPFDRPVRRVWGPGIVVVGDAAGYFDPLTGQGVYRALRSSELAATAVEETLRAAGPPWPALRGYDRALRSELAPGRRVQRAVEAVMSRRWVRRSVLRRLANTHGLDAVIRVTGDADPAIRLADPRWWGQILLSG